MCYNCRMIKAVIFDLDGTMVETENSVWVHVNHILAEKHGKKFDESVRKKMMGRKESEALQIFLDHHQIDATVEQLVEERQELLLQLVDRVKANPGLYELITLLNKMGIKKGIATSSFYPFASKVLEKVNLTSEFEVFVTGNQIRNGKPHPEIFLTVAKKLDVDPKDCLVLEDAQNGVEGAYNAGMKVIAIPHQYSVDHDFSKATMILKSLTEVTSKLLHVL